MSFSFNEQKEEYFKGYGPNAFTSSPIDWAKYNGTPLQVVGRLHDAPTQWSYTVEGTSGIVASGIVDAISLSDAVGQAYANFKSVCSCAIISIAARQVKS